MQINLQTLAHWTHVACADPVTLPPFGVQADVQASLALGDEILREMDAQTA